MTEYIFTTPIVEEGPAGGHRLFSFYKLNKGITIIRNTDGTYAQVRYLVDDETSGYPEIYFGGRNYTVDDTTKTRLLAANVGITEANFTAI